MKFVSLASSSSGNCTLVSYKNTNILVDCGISKKRVVDALKDYNLTLDDIKCIFVTHEHSDHISGIASILKDHDIKIVSQRATLIKIFNDCETKGIHPNVNSFKIVCPVNIMNENSGLIVGDIVFYTLKGNHDVPSVYYKFILGDTVIAILTDIGAYNEYNIRSLEDVNYLMLECNYDEQMMLDNEYPSWLKARIMSNNGHLSNVDCAELIMKLANDKLKAVYLSHISEKANTEDYAYEFVMKYLNENCDNADKLPIVKVAKRLALTEIINET